MSETMSWVIIWMLLGHSAWLAIMCSDRASRGVSFFGSLNMLLTSWIMGPTVWLWAAHDVYYL